MTIVMVHGVPETDAIWWPLVEELGRDDVVLLSPPAFGAPVPDGFAATHSEYCDWLENELAWFSEPVDLVGHDWGGGHVLNLVMHRPELVRSWVSDVLGIFDADYVWHDLAQAWSTPGAGEELVAAMLGGTLAERIAQAEGMGMPPDVAAAVAAGQDEAMGRAILALYRSTAQPVAAELGRGLERAAARPGLAILATEDSYVGTDEMRRRAAGRAGARVEVLDGLGHWWMLEDPARGAAALTRFWGALPH
jgi:pimeloyl-ACP methyl ester carboxylesterase